MVYMSMDAFGPFVQAGCWTQALNCHAMTSLQYLYSPMEDVCSA